MREERYKTKFQGGIFHVYNRGADGRAIFLDDDDRHSYVERLAHARKDFNITPLAYCLMPNHIHLLLRQDSDEPIARLMSALHTSHAKRFNIKHRRFGHLFQGRFRQAVIRRNNHLLHVIAYIHLNPLEARLIPNLEEYRWNSHAEYLNPESAAITDAREGLEFFGGKKNYLHFLEEMQTRPLSKRWKTIQDFMIES